MSTFVVKAFPTGNPSDDGTIVTVTMETADGQSHQLEVPFDQIEWLHQALLHMSSAAHKRQVKSGRLAPAVNAANAPLIAETIRVLPNTAKKHVLIQAAGRQRSAGPVGIGSMIVNENGARLLARRLLEVAEQLKAIVATLVGGAHFVLGERARQSHRAPISDPSTRRTYSLLDCRPKYVDARDNKFAHDGGETAHSTV